MARTTLHLRLALLAAPLTLGSAFAQAPSMPTPTPVPASSIPSIPAPSTEQPQSTRQPPQQPASTIQQTPDSQQPTPPPAQPQTRPASPTTPYQDPLDAPIVVKPTVSQPTDVTLAPPPTVVSLPSAPAYDLSSLAPTDRPDFLGSTYIPVDSIVYPLALRLYSLGYLDTAFIGMRPWTRRSLLHALQLTTDDVNNAGDEQAQQILARLLHELAAETPGKNLARGRVYGVESVYTRLMGITDTPLRDSFHLGQTIVNDYGRPYAKGFNNVTGFTSVNEMGRFSLYVRGEYQHAPRGDSYPLALATTIASLDERVLPQPPVADATIPFGPTVNAQNPFRLQEATLSYHIVGHEISFGKSDAWIGPGLGGALAWSDNAEDIYSFRINRVEPLHIPYLSALLGPLRYDFFVGSLKGHIAPNDPWIHSETFAFAPTANFQFGFQRTVIWGGKGHEPITLHTFFKSFFDISDTTPEEKNSRNDPGARFSAFNFSYRLPFVRRYLTLYTDSIAHDDVTPPSAPRRAAYRPGLFLSQFPHLPKLDLRVEAVSTDTSTLRSVGGGFNYFEIIQLQGYTNKGFILGDWIGREAKGGQAWLTYHLSGDEWVQLEYLNKKTPKDFIPQGTTQNQFKLDVVKNLTHDLTVDAWLQYERWKAPIYVPGQRSDTTIAAQFTWRPKLHTTPVPAR
ncbi:MAG: capsule assembly Wzi family protein [Acidobacteriota bacterium]|nr:capsule assembly Wzi family protein [Acidobacteriota bacterium]